MMKTKQNPVGSDGYYIVLSDPTEYINQILKRKKNLENSEHK